MAIDKRDALRRAQNAVQQSRPGEALQYLWQIVDRSHLLDEEFRSYLRVMEQSYAALGQRRAAGTVASFLGNMQGAAQYADGHHTDLARVAIATGQASAAAKHYNNAGWLGHAAIQLEDAGDHRSARVLWERLADNAKLRDDLYTQGLVRFNLGRACLRVGDKSAARKAVITSMHLLEAAADGFETRGLRERAFDCFQILLTLGKEGAFENLAEGYLNCIRILKEDNLKYYVLQYYEDFQELALKSGELHAAATLFREAAEFSRRYNMPYERHYRTRAAETQVLAANRMLESGGLPEMAENAYAAAIDLFNDLGAYSKVREVYGFLAQLELGDKRQARYLRLQERLAGVRDEGGQTVSFPDYLRMDTAYPEIWRLDVIEWEQGGDAAETMGEVLLDSKWPDFTRRRALLCRLHQLESAQLTPERLVGLATHLGRVEIYASLSPLEHIVEHEDPTVRAAVLSAVRQLFFKRSFVLVNKGLADDDPRVQRESLQAVGALHFGHAFDPLQRIYRESPHPQVRKTALSSIGKIQSLEAIEMLIDVLRQGDPEERRIGRDLLHRADHVEVDTLLHRAAANETGPIQSVIHSVLKARGSL